MSRGRPELVTKEEVFISLKDGEWHFMDLLANRHDCCRKTLKNKINQLLDDGYCILNGPKGVKLIDKDDIDEATTGEILKMVGWLFGTVAGMARRAVPVKRLMPTVRKQLPKTKEERLYLRGMLVRMTHLIDWQSLDDMDEE